MGSYDLQGCKESDTIEVTYHGEVVQLFKC